MSFHKLAFGVLLALLVGRSSAEECANTGGQGSCLAADEAQKAQMSLLQTGLEVNKVVALDTKTPPAAKVPAEEWSIKMSRAEASGVKSNAAGDLVSFLTGFFTNIFATGFLACVFMFLRERYPKTYMRNLETNQEPINVVPEGRLGWMEASAIVDTDALMQSGVGLDMAMMLEFANLGKKIFTLIGIPMFCIMGPMHLFFGGGRAGDDKLSYMSFGNIVDGHWMHWIHACIVWGVVFVVQKCAFEYQATFLTYRYKWLRDLPIERAHTILVEGIPEEHQSDSRLKDFFEKMFGTGSVTSSYMVKDAPELEAKCAERDAKKYEVSKANYKASDENASDEDKKQLLTAAQQSGEELVSLEKEVKVLRESVKKKSSQAGPDGFNTSAGFVTFAKHSDATFALDAIYSEDCDEWEVSIPPEPTSILWADLQQGVSKGAGFTILGYSITAGLFFLYMPSIIWMTQISVRINMGPFQPLWAAFAPTVGLQVMVGFLPTFLILIFKCCFTLKAEIFSQLQLQKWFFVFQLVFVVLVTALGASVGEFMETLATRPFSVFTIFGKTMPEATHFYMKFVCLQWLAHAMVLTRYVQLGKYLIFRQVFGEDFAVESSEPEDQDYYGIGSRSARMTIIATVGLVYGTLCPPINILVFMEFYLVRVLYGYLLPFAESKKVDTGGAFWVLQLHQLFIGTLLYCVVMVGVLLGRGATNGPAMLAFPSIFYALWCMRKLERNFNWQKLPLKELKLVEAEKARRSPKADRDDVSAFVQPMFLQDSGLPAQSCSMM